MIEYLSRDVGRIQCGDSGRGSTASSCGSKYGGAFLKGGWSRVLRGEAPACRPGKRKWAVCRLGQRVRVVLEAAYPRERKPIFALHRAGDSASLRSCVRHHAVELV